MSEPWPWYDENGVFETLQVLILLVMLVRYLTLLRYPSQVLRAMFAGAALLVLGCILREVEFDREGPLGWADAALRGPGRIIAIVIAIPTAIWAGRILLEHPRAGPRLVLGTWWGRGAVLGAMIVALAGLYDRGIFIDLPSHRWEELFETIGYAFMATSTFIPARVAEASIERPLWGATHPPPLSAELPRKTEDESSSRLRSQG